MKGKKIGTAMKIKGAIFDLDGTLLDSMYVWDTLGTQYLINRGIEPEEGLDDKFKTFSIIQAAEYYQTQYGITDSVEKITDDLNKMVEYEYFNNIKPKKGVIKMLEKFKANSVKMCIATATDRYLVEECLKNNNMIEYFSGIFTCTEVGAGKDKPLIFEAALKHLGTDKTSTYIFEDSTYAIQTAKNAGFNVIGIADEFAQGGSSGVISAADEYVTDYDEWINKLV